MKAALLMLLLAGLPAVAQVTDSKLPISLDAESTYYDGKSSMLIFRGLKISQGIISIQADEGRATKLDFDDATWEFSGHVIIDVESGHIECDHANLQFEGHEVKFATITGTPAKFDLKREGSDQVTHAEAGKLHYDLGANVVEFSDNATISEGGNKISSDFLVYNINEQRIKAQSGSDGDHRVKITYTPSDTGIGKDDKPTAVDGTAGSTTKPDGKTGDATQ